VVSAVVEPAGAAHESNAYFRYQRSHSTLAELFQTTATINTGNSGGPLFNMAGEVIGIVSQNISKSGGSEGLGFIVTINTAEKVLADRKVFWGALQGVLLTSDLAAIFNVPAPAGFLVKRVAQGSMAWNMGLAGGNRIVTIDGKEIALGTCSAPERSSRAPAHARCVPEPRLSPRRARAEILSTPRSRSISCCSGMATRYNRTDNDFWAVGIAWQYRWGGGL
jgi:hypothetical protein